MARVSRLAVGIFGLAAVLGDGRRVDVKAVMAAMRKVDAPHAPDTSESHMVFQNGGQMIFQMDNGVVPGSPAATVTNVLGAPAQPQRANVQPQVEHATPQALVSTSSQQQPDAAPQVQQIKDAAQSAAHEVAGVGEDTSESHVVFNNDGQMIFQIETGLPPAVPPATNVENATSATNSSQQPNTAAQGQQSQDAAASSPDLSESDVVVNNGGQMIFQMDNFLLPGTAPATVTNLVGAPEQPQQASAGGVQNVVSQDAILEAALASQAAAVTNSQQQPQEQNH